MTGDTVFGTQFRRTGALTLAYALAACAPPEADTPVFEVFDSSGVEVVVSHAPSGFVTPWTLTPEPLLRIGKGREEEPYFFEFIRAATRLDDGSIVVLDRPSNEVRRFDSQGQHLLTFGGRGEGPEEFTSPMGMERLGDTLTILDSDGTVTRFDSNGRLLDGIPLDGLRAGDGPSPGDWQGVLADGVIWGARYPRPLDIPTGSVYRSSQYLVIADERRTQTTVVTEYLAGANFQVSEGGRFGFLPQYRTQVLPSRHPVGFLLGNNETFTIDRFDSDGTHRLRIKYPEGIQEDEEQRVEEQRRIVLEGHEAYAESRPGFNAGYPRWLRGLPNARVWPGFDYLIGDEDGYIWALEYRSIDGVPSVIRMPTDAPRSAYVFHTAGHLLGSVELPGRLSPYEIGTDYVLGVERDDFGVYEVVLYGLLGR